MNTLLKSRFDGTNRQASTQPGVGSNRPAPGHTVNKYSAVACWILAPEQSCVFEANLMRLEHIQHRHPAHCPEMLHLQPAPSASSSVACPPWCCHPAVQPAHVHLTASL